MNPIQPLQDDEITNGLAGSFNGQPFVTYVRFKPPHERYRWNGSILVAEGSGGGGSGDVTKVGTPANNQVGVWTGDGTLEGDAGLTFDTATDTLAIAASGNLAFGAVTVLEDNAGTMTLQNIDALDATTEATIEAAIDALENLTSIQGHTVTLTGAFVRAGAHSLTITTTGATSVTLPESGTLAVANAAVTLSTGTTLDRATHNLRQLVCDTAAAHVIPDDTTGGWGSGDAVGGINTSSGVVTFAGESTGTASTVTAAAGKSLTGYPYQEFDFARTAANTWVGGFPAPDVMALTVSDETTALTTGTSKVTFRWPYKGRLVGARAGVGTASSSGIPTFDVNEAGTTMMSTKLTIDASETTSTTAATPVVISDALFDDDAVGSVDVDVAGTGTLGAKVWLYMVPRP